MSATPMALRTVANAQPVASVQSVVSAMRSHATRELAAKGVVKPVAHAKTATAVDAAKAARVRAANSKGKPPSTPTPPLKPKPKLAPKHATNAWPAKSAAKALKTVTIHANPALNVQSVVSVVKVAKVVANAVHVANATMADANAPLV